MRRSLNDPQFFATYVLGLRLRRWQRQLMGELKKRLMAGSSYIKIVCRTCHGAGKTLVCAALVLWLVSTHRDSRCLTTAPTWAGVENLLWPEVRRLYDRSLLAKVKFGNMGHVRWTVENTWYAVGAASDRPENLEGHHSGVAAMRIIDEAKAVPDPVYNATFGMLDAPRNIDIWISTPALQVGKFYERDVNDSTDVIRMRVTIDDLIADGVRGKEIWKQNALIEYGGETSEIYRARALAEYMEHAEGALIPAKKLKQAMERQFAIHTLPTFGWDVAGSFDGDQNGLAGVWAEPPREIGSEFVPDARHFTLRLAELWHEYDTTKNIPKVRALLREAQARRLRIDVNGLGKTSYDIMQNFADQDRLIVEPYRSGETALHEDDYLNRKAEDAFAFRNAFLSDRIAVDFPDAYRDKAVAAFKGMRYLVKPDGKIRIEDPAISPDAFDASLMAFSLRGGADWAKVSFGGGGVYTEPDDEYEDERVYGPGDAEAYG